ncbi:hypothetical protein COCNU_04G013350 [Cocos nucifera]|uniref:Uncharacterized protein n=1 Tax=Cocos nucifera TaxID=13894 RepID=A0A8K0I7V6_COCNU|nr:hypothetical protein COCNU_04G013350 [Cocos nucifera]
MVEGGDPVTAPPPNITLSDFDNEKLLRSITNVEIEDTSLSMSSSLINSKLSSFIKGKSIYDNLFMAQKLCMIH